MYDLKLLTQPFRLSHDPACDKWTMFHEDRVLSVLSSGVISLKFLIKYYEYSFDYPIIIMNQLMINAHT